MAGASLKRRGCRPRQLLPTQPRRRRARRSVLPPAASRREPGTAAQDGGAPLLARLRSRSWPERVTGHRNMSTTNQYLHLAGVVFRDEAASLEQRLLGGLGGGGSEQNVVVDGVGNSLLRNRDDDITSVDIVPDDFVGNELVIGDVGKAEVSPAFALDDVDVVADQHGRKFYPPETISDDLSAAEASGQAVALPCDVPRKKRWL